MSSSFPILSEEKPWYKKGLRFKCTECGKCCTGTPGYTWVSLDEIEMIAEYLNLSIEAFAMRYLREVDGRYALKELSQTHACIFLQDNKCRIYPVRPAQCKTFPWWMQVLESEEDWQEAARYCEGINHPEANVTSYEDIQKNLGCIDV